MARAPRLPEELIADECHSMPLRMLHRVVTGIYDQALRPLDLRVAQLNILVAVARMAGDATAARIGKYLSIEKSTLSRDLERMIGKRWIETIADGRSRSLQLSAEGRRLLERALPAWSDAQARVQELLGKSALDAIGAAADRIRSR
jgi:DNA-binding MarR family transcriptional regulator